MRIHYGSHLVPLSKIVALMGSPMTSMKTDSTCWLRIEPKSTSPSERPFVAQMVWINVMTPNVRNDGARIECYWVQDRQDSFGIAGRSTCDRVYPFGNGYEEFMESLSRVMVPMHTPPPLFGTIEYGDQPAKEIERYRLPVFSIGTMRVAYNKKGELYRVGDGELEWYRGL